MCVFCQIIEGKIPATKVYEDDAVIAFLDIAQTTKGHTLVVPKRHYDFFLKTPKTIMHRVMDVAQRIGQAQLQTLHAKGVNVLTNNLEAAGQTVFHFHVHVIPRYDARDKLQLEMHENENRHDLNLPAIAQQLKTKL